MQIVNTPPHAVHTNQGHLAHVTPPPPTPALPLSSLFPLPRHPFLPASSAGRGRCGRSSCRGQSAAIPMAATSRGNVACFFLFFFCFRRRRRSCWDNDNDEPRLPFLLAMSSVCGWGRGRGSTPAFCCCCCCCCCQLTETAE